MEAEVEINSTGQVMLNPRAESRLAAEAAEMLGLPVRWDYPPMTGGDDFAFIVARTAGSYVMIGNGPAVDGGTLHNERYEFNDAILPAAVNWMATVARRTLAGNAG